MPVTLAERPGTFTVRSGPMASPSSSAIAIRQPTQVSYPIIGMLVSAGTGHT